MGSRTKGNEAAMVDQLIDKKPQLTLEEIMETLTEEQAKFILHASIVGGHLRRYWFDEAVKLARMVQHD